ncbi:beta-ketoacyl-[acyl-carrier-protein] synthase family protein [Streptomyces chrestomyceticus]|uniref:beta-ketoacyl-[acyl-carrier-protein] synthase family protein n=1 Tax=Streptomyces chrestomyceticus TaxID=68185 RepID=UPI0019CF5CD0|nr:beta-ketoacyl-[acyl-carrier-protein] synthase family protein [Streptomyces chrestomyceticus]
MLPPRRVVITGIGVVAPRGIGVKNFWETLTSGRSATRNITAFDATGFRSRIAAECEFRPEENGLTEEQARRMSRSSQFAHVAAREALEQSGLEVTDRVAARTGVALGSAVGSVRELDRAYRDISGDGSSWELTPGKAGPYLADYNTPSSLVREIAWLTGAQGPAAMISAGCTSGLDSVGYACDILREGSADVVIAGATDAPITPITVACFDAIKATSPNNDDPGHASRPFDRDRDGFVLGEGAAVFVLETAEHAHARGAHVIAEVAAFAARCNAHHMTALRPDGREMSAAIDAALATARVAPEAIDYINAHGSGTKQNDRHETAAYKRSLGDAARTTPVSSIKSVIGHSLGAIGSIELAACALAIEHGVIPPTANLHTPDPDCDLDYVPLEAREQRVDVALSVGSGFGGFQSAAVLVKEGANR